MTKVKVTSIGNSVGIVLPKEILDYLHVAKGDYLSISNAPSGAIRLSPMDERKERQLEIAEKVMRENRNLLRKLAE